MAGLLDYVFNSPEGRMGLGLLALGQMPKSQGMQGLMGLLASQDAAAKSKADSAWQEEARGRQRKEWSQADAATERAAQMDAAKRRFFFGDGGLLGAGSVGGSSAPAVDGAGVIPESPQVAPSGGKIKEWSEKLGIPQDAIVADYLQNGGKGIAEMLYKRGTPDMQVTSGYAYDKNKLGAGFMPSLSTSQDGKTSMVRIGQDGLPVVTSPQGALETYNAYQQAAASHKPIKVYNPQTGREEFTSEAAVVRPSQNFTGSGYSGGSSGSAAQEQRQIMEYELSRLPQGHPDRQALMREIARLPGGGSQAYAAGPSAAEAAANEARRVQAVEQVKADISPTSTKIAAVDTARDAIAVIDKALSHPGLKTSTGLQGTIDPRNYIPGTDATNFRVLIDQVKGGVFLDAYKDLRGGGAITEAEGAKAEAAKARINRAQSPDEFVKGLNEYRDIVARGYERAAARASDNGGASQPAKQSKQPVKTGMYNGRKVVQYSDGSVDYAD